MSWLNKFRPRKTSTGTFESSSGNVASAPTLERKISRGFLASLPTFASGRRENSSASLPNVQITTPLGTEFPSSSSTTTTPGPPVHPPTTWSRHTSLSPNDAKSRPPPTTTSVPNKSRSLDDIRTTSIPRPQSQSRPTTARSSSFQESMHPSTTWRTPLGFELPIIHRPEASFPSDQRLKYPSSNRPRPRLLPSSLSNPLPLLTSAPSTIRLSQPANASFKATLASTLPESVRNTDPTQIIVIIGTASPDSNPVCAPFRQLTSRPSYLATYLRNLLPPTSCATSSSAPSSTRVESKSSASEIIPIFIDRPSGAYPYITSWLCSSGQTLPVSLLAERDWIVRFKLVLQVQEEAVYLGLKELEKLCGSQIKKMSKDQDSEEPIVKDVRSHTV